MMYQLEIEQKGGSSNCILRIHIRLNVQLDAQKLEKALAKVVSSPMDRLTITEQGYSCYLLSIPMNNPEYVDQDLKNILCAVEQIETDVQTAIYQRKLLDLLAGHQSLNQ